MAWIPIAHVEVAATGGPITTAAIDTTGADLIIAVQADYAATVRVVTDSKGNVWTPLTQYGSSADRCRIHYCRPTTVGAGHTFTLSGASGFPALLIAAFRGSLASPFGVENGFEQAGASLTVQAGSITPPVAGSLVVAAVAVDAGIPTSIGSGFTLYGSIATTPGEGGGVAYLDQTVAAAVNPTWTNSTSTAMTAAIASFAPALPASASNMMMVL